MGQIGDIVFRYGLMGGAESASAPVAPRVSVTISPNGSTDPAEGFLIVIAISQAAPTGSVDIAQSGDLTDDDFNTSFVEAIETAVAATVGVTFDGVNTLSFTSTFPGILRIPRIIESDPPAGQDYLLTLSNVQGGLVIGIATASYVTVDEDEEPVPTGAVKPGINLAVAEFGSTNVLVDGQPTYGILGDTYTYPEPDDVPYYVERGFRVFRIPFKWVRMQALPMGELTVADVTRLDELVAAILAYPHTVCLPDLHEFAGRRPAPGQSTVTLGVDPVTTDALANLWIRLFTEERNGIVWKDDYPTERLLVGLFNEPEGAINPLTGQPRFLPSTWRDLALATITAIRAGGVTNTIMVPGSYWSGAHSWTTLRVDGFSNATAWAGQLPANCRFEVHQYLDSDSSGTSRDATPGAGATRLVEFTEWARANGYKANLGEFGFADNPGMYEEGEDLLFYMDQNPDVWESWTYWAGGPWWDDYYYSVDPSGPANNPISKPQMSLLLDFTLPIADQDPPTDVVISNTLCTTLLADGAVVGELTVSDPNGSRDFHTFSLVESAGGRFKIVGKQVQRTAVPVAVGETWEIEIDAIDRAGNTLVGGPKSVSIVVVPSPNVTFNRTGGSTRSEGANLNFHMVITEASPGISFDLWCSGNVPAQMVGTWYDSLIDEFNAAGCTVRSRGHTRVTVTTGVQTPSGAIDWAWQAKADLLTEGAAFQANFFCDNPQGCTIDGGDSEVVSYFINDTSLTPGWVIQAGTGSAFPGQNITFTLRLNSPGVGAKVRINASGTATEADFTASLDADIAAALPPTLSYNSATNEIEVIGSFPGSFPFTRTVALDADGDETYTLTLSDPVSSVVVTPSVSILIRQVSGTVTIYDQNFLTGVHPETEYQPRFGEMIYPTASGFAVAAADEMPANGAGIVLSGPVTNMIINPRGDVGGTVGAMGSGPTDWAWVGTGVGDFKFYGRGIEASDPASMGLPYVEYERVFNGAFSEARLAFVQRGNLDASLSLRGTFGARISHNTTASPNLEVRVSNNVTHDGGSKNTYYTTGSHNIGPKAIWFGLGGPLPALVSPQAANFHFRILGAVLTGTIRIRIYPPQLTNGSTANFPSLPAAGTTGASARGASEIVLGFVPPDEGTVFMDFDHIGRDTFGAAVTVGGDVFVTIFNSSDPDNYIEVGLNEGGLLRLTSVIDGVVVCNITGDYVVTTHQWGRRLGTKLAFRYAELDYVLVLDGRVVGNLTGQQVPRGLDRIYVGKDRNNEHYSSMLLRKITVRSDLRLTENLLADTSDVFHEYFAGINQSGAEFSSNDGPQFWPKTDQSNGHAGWTYWATNNFKHIRLPFLITRVQRNGVGTPIPANEMLLISTRIEASALHGIPIILDNHSGRVHNVVASDGTRTTHVVGSAEYPYSALASFWVQISRAFRGHPGLWGFDFMNEPSTDENTLKAAYQACIDAIRADGDTTSWFFVEGGFFSSAYEWSNRSDGMHLTDPQNKIYYSAHSYIDADRSGNFGNNYTSEGGSPERWFSHLTPFASFLDSNGYRGHIGETGVPKQHDLWATSAYNHWKVMRKHGWPVSLWGGSGEWPSSYNLEAEPTGPLGAKVHQSQTLKLIQLASATRAGTPAAPTTVIANMTKAQARQTLVAVGSGPELGSNLTNLGRIRLDSPYPSNPWAMQLYDNKIWVGTGNSADVSPNSNAGSGDLRYIDMADDGLKTSTYLEAAIADEQIDKFRVIDGDLVFPGIDPTSGPIYFHRLADGVWSKHQVASTFQGTGTTIPHLFDIYKFGGAWFGAIGTAANGWELYKRTTASDGIGGWANTQHSGLPLGASRAGIFFELGGVLYGTRGTSQSDFLVSWNGTNFVLAGIARATALPSTTLDNNPNIQKAELIGSRLVYIGGLPWNDSHWTPHIAAQSGLYAASTGFTSVSKIALPTDELPFDLKVRGTTAYVLTNKKLSDTSYEVRVRSSTTPFTTWTQVLMFEYSSFARSFEANTGATAWYFGIGTDITNAQAVALGYANSYTTTIRTESGIILKWTV